MNQKLRKLLKANFLKSVYLSFRYKSKILVGKNTDFQLYSKSKIETESGRLDIAINHTWKQKTAIDIGNHATLRTTGNVSIHSGSKIMLGNNAELIIGKNSYINEHSRVQCRKEISIGEGCVISWNVNILDTDEHEILYDGKPKEKAKPVLIGDHCWIGCNTTILKGVKLGEGCVVAAGSVVTKSFPAKSLIAGNPARVIKENINWK